DGANGTTAKALGLGDGIVHGVAFEGNAPYTTLERGRYGRRAVIELADIPGGYGWVFPKAEHANVGVGAWQSAGPHLRDPLSPATTSAGCVPRTASSPTRSRSCEAIDCRCGGPAHASRGSGRSSSVTPRG